MPFHRLTPREREVADLVLAGRTAAAVARELHMAPATVRTHVRNIAVKLANPHGLPAVRLIRSYAAVAILAQASAPPEHVENRAAVHWAGAGARRSFPP